MNITQTSKNIFQKSSILVIATLAISTMPASVRAENTGLEQIFSFGNSISDTGNVFSLTGGSFPPSPLYDGGRFTNGSIWIDYLSADLGLDIDNFYGGGFSDLGDGLNFAVGGATTGTTSVAGVGFPGMTTQVENFIDFLGGETVDEDALVIFLGGGENDYVENFFSTGELLSPAVPIGNIANSLTQLASAGAENILIPNLINLDEAPLGQSLVPPEFLGQLRLLTDAHNAALDSAVASLATAFPETTFAVFDINSTIENIINNPADFGLIDNPLESCLSPNNFPDLDPDVVVCANPEQYVYYDNQHFTTTIHQLVANSALETIHEEFGVESIPVPESSNTIALIGLGVGLLTALGRKRH